MADYYIVRGSQIPWISPLILVSKPSEKTKELAETLKDEWNQRIGFISTPEDSRCYRLLMSIKILYRFFFYFQGLPKFRLNKISILCHSNFQIINKHSKDQRILF